MNIVRRDSQVLYAPIGSNSLPLSSTDALFQEESTTVARKYPFEAWVYIVTSWTLAIHCILSVGITIIILVYIDQNHFNISERSPPVRVLEGTRTSSLRLMQSDVVTFLSSIIAVLKWALAAWAASLCWRIAFFMMERRGLAHRDLKTLLDYGLLSPRIYSRDWTTPIIGALLLTSLVAGLSSPVLSGSISWLPDSQLATSLLPLDPIYLPHVEDGTLERFPDAYRDLGYEREGLAMHGSGFANMGWSHEVEKGVLRHVSHSVRRLETNSTVENATIPYFGVHSIRWVTNVDEIPFIRDNGIFATLAENRDMAPVIVNALPLGVPILVPNATATSWSSDPLELRTIQETVLLMFPHTFRGVSDVPFSVTQSLPHGLYSATYSEFDFAFAWLTYSAGVGRCRDYTCRISTSSAIENTTAIELEPHQLTYQSMFMSSVVAFHLVQQNVSIPFIWDNPEDYIEAVLVRAYSGAWSALNWEMSTGLAQSNYVPALPGLLAKVDRPRVHIWLGLQLLVTLLSLFFIIFQARLSKHPLVDDTTFAAFYLDTTEIPRHGGVEKDQLGQNRLLKVELRGDRWKVMLD